MLVLSRWAAGAALAVAMLSATTLGCQGGSEGRDDPKAVLAGGVSPPTPTPTTAAAKAPPATTTAVTAFPAVDTSGLDPAGLAFFTKLVNDETCPCDCPKSFAQCLQEGTACKPAVLLANWLIGQLASGVPGEMFAEPIARELHAGFSATPKTLVVDGYASKGPKQAKHTIVEFADFECTHCRAAVPMMDEFVAKHPDVRVVYKHFPLSIHPNARAAAIAAEAAGKQGKFWEMHAAIFATQDFITDDLLHGHAKALGLDIARFEKDLKDPAIAKLVDDSRKEGDALGLNGTPAFFVDGRPYHLSRSVDGLELRLSMDEARASSSCK